MSMFRLLNCKNYNICKQKRIDVSSLYCYDCLSYFNKIIEITKNINNKQCPICLDDDIDLDIYQLDQCEHIICKSCLINICFNSNQLITIPINPIKKFSDKWFIFITSRRSNQLKKKIIKKYVAYYFHTFDDLSDDLFIYNRNIYIPPIFKHDIIDLIDYQIRLEKYINEFRKKKDSKIKYLRICSYCRKESYNII